MGLGVGWLATLPFGRAAFQRYDEWLYSHFQRFCGLFFFHAAGTTVSVLSWAMNSHETPLALSYNPPLLWS